jgi:hypothetical protein
MRPSVSVEEALAWLRREATETWGIDSTPALDEALLPTAEAMVAVSEAPIPDDIEPLLV